jgi:predicted dehydrogenase
MLAAGPETTLAGVWARRPDAATQLAERHGAPAFEQYEALLEVCDAVAFAVPPAVQVDMAVHAARAGKAVLLEKPVAESLAGAQHLADVVEEEMVGSLVVLSYRFAMPVMAFLADAVDLDTDGGRCAFISDAFIGGLFSSSPWRQLHGALLDLGPHAIDLMDAALGPVVDVAARRTGHDWVTLLLTHEGGAISTVQLSGSVAMEPPRFTAEVYGRAGLLEVDAMAAVGPDAFACLREEFAQVARTGQEHECDVRRGLHLQKLLDRAAAQLP